MLILPGKTSSWSAGSSYTENLVSNPGTRYIDLGTGSLPADTRSMLYFWSGTHAETTRVFMVDYNTSFSRIWCHDGVDVGWYCDWRTSDGVGNDYVDATLSGVRHHVLMQVWSTTLSPTSTLNAEWYIAEGSGAWALAGSVATTTGATAEIFDDITDTAGRLFARLNGSEIFSGDTARCAMWVDNTVGRIADLSSSAVTDEFVSSGATVDPATTQATYSGQTLLWDLYGEASRWEAGTNDGVLSLTPAGSGSFSNA